MKSFFLTDEKKWGKKRKKWRKKTKKKKLSEKKEASHPTKEYKDAPKKEEIYHHPEEDKVDDEHYDEEEGRVSLIPFYCLILVIVFIFSCIKCTRSQRNEKIEITNRNLNQEANQRNQLQQHTTSFSSIDFTGHQMNHPKNHQQ